MLFAAVLTLALTAQDKDIVDITMSSDNHTTLVSAIETAGLVNILKGEGPFTIFAPTNAAFDQLPEGTVSALLKPESKGQLNNILTYHVVSGKMMAADVIAAIKAGGGEAVLETIQGGNLTASLDGDRVKLVDAKGNISYVTSTNLSGNNGVVHVIDNVLMPS